MRNVQQFLIHSTQLKVSPDVNCFWSFPPPTWLPASPTVGVIYAHSFHVWSTTGSTPYKKAPSLNLSTHTPQQKRTNMIHHHDHVCVCVDFFVFLMFFFRFVDHGVLLAKSATRLNTGTLYFLRKQQGKHWLNRFTAPGHPRQRRWDPPQRL